MEKFFFNSTIASHLRSYLNIITKRQDPKDNSLSKPFTALVKTFSS